MRVPLGSAPDLYQLMPKITACQEFFLTPGSSHELLLISGIFPDMEESGDYHSQRPTAWARGWHAEDRASIQFFRPPALPDRREVGNGLCFLRL